MPAGDSGAKRKYKRRYRKRRPYEPDAATPETRGKLRPDMARYLYRRGIISYEQWMAAESIATIVEAMTHALGSPMDPDRLAVSGIAGAGNPKPASGGFPRHLNYERYRRWYDTTSGLRIKHARPPLTLADVVIAIVVGNETVGEIAGDHRLNRGEVRAAIKASLDRW